MDTVEVVCGFWDAMAGNDFHAASMWLAEDFEGYWPQSQELIQGRQAFGAVNTDYPAAGPWRFDLRHLVVDGDRAVSDVTITDGDVLATAITFHWVQNGLIWRQLEYWPDPMPRPQWRAELVTVVARPDFPN